MFFFPERKIANNLAVRMAIMFVSLLMKDAYGQCQFSTQYPQYPHCMQNAIANRFPMAFLNVCSPNYTLHEKRTKKERCRYRQSIEEADLLERSGC